jgi:hypothetical protein
VEDSPLDCCSTAFSRINADDDAFGNVDLGIYRHIELVERRSAQFRAEVFNVANRAAFVPPVRSAVSATFGHITGAVTSGGFGAQRQFLLALKLVF